MRPFATHRPRTACRAAAILIACLPAAALAGELDPPAGPVAPTMKDLEDVEPRTVLRNDFDTLTPIAITQPGSYKLGEDILALPNESGITISASNVTLDLNGFTIQGNQEVGSVDGVLIVDERDNITIRNGNIVGFFEIGVRGEFADNVRFENLNLNFNVIAGAIARFNVIYTNCAAQGNGGLGLGAGGNASFTGCASYDNGAAGFVLGGNSAATNCAALRNEGNGFSVGDGSTLTNCAARENEGNGFDTGQHSTLMNCAAVDNTMHGFQSVNACAFVNCTASINDMDGFRVVQSLVRGCVTNANGGVGYNNVAGSIFLDNLP